MRCAGLFVFTPGLDVVGICERCARVASGDVAAAPGCFAAVPSLYVFGPEDGEQLDKRGDAVHLCPFCGSDDISGDSWEQDGPTVSQVVDCLDCGETWVDSYQFVGFERVERSGGGE
jgi:RNA polymerase subunit RPABC4/transcription elongation factor Spt4